MRIERLDIKGFGKFNNFEIEFGRGFNVVFGANESGKSTIEAFIKAMFYSLKGGRNFKGGTSTPLKRYKPWSGIEYKGSMKYTLDNGQSFTVERNFENGETRVYDLLYKDITKTFDQSKDKGPLFAISHIGLTESCFEKTLYIGQMATKLDTCDSKEILDRLSNISETGFEDISFMGACDAIKEALKNYVGTGKTSTRPLDIINSKIDQLNLRRKRLYEVKESLFSVEEEITLLTGKRENLEKGKTVLQLAKDIVRIREDLDAYKRRKKDLNEIVFEISELNKDCDSLKESITEYKKVKEQFESFSRFGFVEADNLYIEYARYENLKDENAKLLTEIQKLKKCADETEAFLENFKAFNVLGDSTPGIEFDRESINNAEIQKKIMELNIKNRAIVAIMAAICVFLTALLFYGFSKKNYICLIGAFALIVIFAILYVFKASYTKLLNSLISSKVYELNSQNKRISKLEAEFDRNCSTVSDISKSMKEKLLEAAIITSVKDEVRKEHIEAFRSAINKYKETAPYLSNGEDRIVDLYKRIENLYNRTYSICGQKVNHQEELIGILYEIDGKIKKLYENLDIYAYKIKSIYSGSVFEGITYDKLMEIILDLRIEESKGHIEEFTQKIFDRLNETQIILKEKEMVLSGLNDDNNELEKIEEDIRELEVKKEKLEEIGFSLRTALEVLEEANTEIKRDFAPVLNNNMSKIVSSITDCRYEELKVDENLVPRTTEPSIRQIVPISLLSNGTADQMYLALRIALVQTIEKKSEKLPLIMDEILAQYDDTRSLDTIKMLKEMANERQIIFFTCKSREVELVKFVCNNNINIIELI